MLRRYRKLLPVVVATAALALSPAVHAATARLTGGSGYSGTLSSNPAIRQQQLLCDPVDPNAPPPNPFAGSTSTTYDTSIVELIDILPVMGYMITAAVIEVDIDGDKVLLDRAAFFRPDRIGTETGYLQVFFRATDAFIEEAIPDSGRPDYDFLAHDGVEGANTHGLFFRFKDVSDDSVAFYRNFADDGTRGLMPDTLVVLDDNGNRVPIGPQGLEDAVVGGSLLAAAEPLAAPLPASVWGGLSLMAGLGVVRFVRRRGRAA